MTSLEDLYDIGLSAANEAWRKVPAGLNQQEARRIILEAEISAVRNAVLEEAALVADAQLDSARDGEGSPYAIFACSAIADDIRELKTKA